MDYLYNFQGKLMHLWYRVCKWLDTMPPMTLGELSAGIWVLAISVAFGWKGFVVTLLVALALGLQLLAVIKFLEKLDKSE
jgi:hypothetical protein